MGKWPDFEYHVGKWLKYDRSGYNSSHPSLGSPLDLGNPWRPLAILGDPWRHAWKWPFWGKGAIACDVSPVAMIWFPQQCVIVKRYDTLWKGPLNCLNRRTRAWELCGITSWGAGCADASQLTYLYSYLYCLIPIYCFFPDLPGVYTRVTNYLPWIKKNLLNTKWKNDQNQFGTK